MAQLEKVILEAARALFENPRLKMKDLLEWSTAAVEAEKGEVVGFVQELQVYVCVKAVNDRRTARTPRRLPPTPETSAHDRLVEEAKAAIGCVMSDRSIAASVTRDSLRDIRDHLAILLDALESEAEDDEA